jgi:lytic murein transglycosylase
LVAVQPAEAACENSTDFDSWLAGFQQQALAEGISPNTLQAVEPLLSYDEKIIDQDRSQGVFAQSFLQFSDRMVSKYRLKQGAALIKKHKPVFARIQERYGVPAPVLTAFWGLETDFGANPGNTPTLTALATLAYDCRRPEKFRPQLLAALRLAEAGDLPLEEMRGAWAGEIGQTQFMPGDYLERGIDFDGDGRRDLRNSAADALASTANFLTQEGWQAGEPWIEEVRVPAEMPWEEADLAIHHPRAKWAKWGITNADGSPIAADQMNASLLLPMGRDGPAFLAYDNFQVFIAWNESLVYSVTAAYYATRLDGAPPVHRGNGEVAALNVKQIFELQKTLVSRGYDVGKIDGKIGAATRAAVKDMQLKLGLPADSYPTVEFLEALRNAS